MIDSSAAVTPLRLVIVGTLPPPTCGTTVSLQHFCDAAARDPRFDTIIVATNGIRGRGLRGTWRFVLTLAQIVWHSFHSDAVVFHLNPTAVPALTPIIWFCKYIAHTSVIIRIFGGQCYTEFKGIRGNLLRSAIASSDLYLAQTQELVENAVHDGIATVKWFPTNRPFHSTRLLRRKEPGVFRFVFVGWVSETKGVRIILQAAHALPSGITIDIYGAFSEGLSAADFQHSDNCHYRGVFCADDAVKTIQQYDALLLPTHWPGEGYPGVITEAYQAGLPVIATNWRSIPELVDDSSGILIPPQNPVALRNAMIQLARDEALFDRLRQGAECKAQLFSTENWMNQFADWVLRLKHSKSHLISFPDGCSEK